jgi:hypothetical protein
LTILGLEYTHYWQPRQDPNQSDDTNKGELKRCSKKSLRVKAQDEKGCKIRVARSAGKPIPVSKP